MAKESGKAYTDIDSFMYEIDTEDVYADFKKIESNQYMDFSEYDKSHTCYHDSIEQVLGKCEYEDSGRIITEVLCLKPKMYAIGTESKTHKNTTGIPSNHVQKKINCQQLQKHS